MTKYQKKQKRKKEILWLIRGSQVMQETVRRQISYILVRRQILSFVI